MDWLSKFGHKKEEVWGILPIDTEEIGGKEERNAFLGHLHRVLQFLATTPDLTGTFVICRQLDVLAIAHSYGMKTFQNNSNLPQQVSIRNISLILRSRGVDGILALSWDAEFITSEHLQTMMYLGRYSYTTVLAPIPENDGTRAFLLKPPACASFRLGADSFKYNLQLAEQSKLRSDIYLPKYTQLAPT
jgi:hypothetical protein